MKRLWGLALIAVIPWLIPWPAVAGSATEYGMMTGQKAAGAPAIQRVGTGTGNNLGVATHKPSSHKKKAKG